MNKLFAAFAITAFVMLPVTVVAAERTANGLQNAEQIEVSSQQRYRRYSTSRRYYGRSYARPYYSRPYYEQSYYARPAYNSYGYSRGPGWGPAPFPFVLGLPY